MKHKVMPRNTSSDKNRDDDLSINGFKNVYNQLYKKAGVLRQDNRLTGNHTFPVSSIYQRIFN
jgi:hypothetical protein